MTDDDGRYVFVNNKKLRMGHTTGTCAAAATKAAALSLITKKNVNSVQIHTPKGITLDLPVEDLSFDEKEAKCAVRKDGGDDIDVTHNTLVYSNVTLTDSGIDIDGGFGVGIVTRKGLDQPVGNAAINRVPRAMIKEVLEDIMFTYGYNGGFKVVISVPAGIDLADKTFNPRLGIEGGISILGTSGIVEPMSEIALINTIKTEMDMRTANGWDTILVVPGNYGKEFTESLPGIDPESAVKCSNFVGEMLDHACSLKKDVLLIGNLGKMVKLAGGIMNTHSRNADCRMEILASNFIMVGGDLETAKEIMNCISTDDALDLISKADLLKEESKLLIDKIEYHVNHRTGGNINTGVIVFSSVYGLLGMTSKAEELLEKVRRQGS